MSDSLQRAHIQEIGMIVRQLKAYDPQKIILFGSCARGDFSDESDSVCFHSHQAAEKVLKGFLH